MNSRRYLLLSFFAAAFCSPAETPTAKTPSEQLVELSRPWYNLQKDAEQYLNKLESLLQAGANSNTLNKHGQPCFFDVISFCLFQSANTGTRALELVLQYGADVHIRDQYGNTALHYAEGKCAQLLLQAGADPNARNIEGEPVILAAIKSIKTRHSDDWQAYLFLAGKTVAYLLDAGADPNAADAHGNTALHYFLQADNCEQEVSKLVAAGANINARNKDGATPLMLGATGFDTLLHFLKTAKPDLNAKDNKGFTALHYAALQGQSAPYDLVKAGAHIDIPIENAILTHNITKFKQLIAEGANINAPGTHNYTPLHWATLCAQPEMVRLLLQAGASADARNADNATPLQLCIIALGAKDNAQECARLLLEAGADIDVCNAEGQNIYERCNSHE